MDNKSNLFSMAIVHLQMAAGIFKGRGDNQRATLIVGFHLQQAAEFGLKHVFNISNCDCAETHDVARLLDGLNNKQLSNVLPDDVKEAVSEFAGTLTLWESRGRSGENLVTSLHKVSVDQHELITGFQVVNGLLSAIASWDGINFTPVEVTSTDKRAFAMDASTKHHARGKWPFSTHK